MQLIAQFVLWGVSSGTAEAHSGGLPVQPDALWTFWSLEPLVVAPLVAVHWLYGRGVIRLWTKGGKYRGISGWNVLCFAAGEIVLIVALVSPLDALGETLLSAHMVQHALLVVVAPPLLIAGKPALALVFALPPPLRRPIGASRPARSFQRLSRWIMRPLFASLAHGTTIWVWHAPPLFEAALWSPTVHWLEHVTFLASAILAWRVMADRARPEAAVVTALATLVHTGLLGALLTLSPRGFYPFYEGRTELWGLSLVEDQQLAGLVMWLPMSAAYIGVGILGAAAIAGRETAPERIHAGRVPGAEA